MINTRRLDWMLHHKLSYILVKTLIKKPPYFSLGANGAHWV